MSRFRAIVGRGKCTALLLLVFSTGCSPGQQHVAGEGTDEIAPGVRAPRPGTVVANPLKVWSAEEEWRVSGSGNGSSPTFRWIRHLEIHPASGDVYVLDSIEQALIVFTADGRYRFTLPLNPDEALETKVISFLWTAGGHLLLRRRASFLELGASGDTVRTVPMPFTPNDPPYAPFPDSDGRIIELRGELVPFSKDSSIIRTRPYRLSADMGRVDTLPPIDVSVPLIPGRALPRPLNDSPVVAAAPDGSLLISRAMEYLLVQRTAEGDTLSSFGLVVVPRKISPEYAKALADGWDAGRHTPLEYISEHHPVVQRIVVEADGPRIFVFPQLEGVHTGSAVDVFRDGIYEGRITLPVSLRVQHHAPVVLGNRICGTVVDERSMEAVVCLAIKGWKEWAGQ